MTNKHLTYEETSYRRAKLAEIERRIAKHGKHIARPHADRARQFMPFAALKGYNELAYSKENEFLN